MKIKQLKKLTSQIQNRKYTCMFGSGHEPCIHISLAPSYSDVMVSFGEDYIKIEEAIENLEEIVEVLNKIQEGI